MNIASNPLLTILSGNWWTLLLRGLLAIAFGILVWLQPGITLKAMVLVFGAFALADGLLGVWTAFAGRGSNEQWWVLLLWGLASAGIGIITFMAPGVTTLVLLFYVAIWAIAIGMLQIIAAVRLRKEIQGEWLLGLAGLAAIAFGAVLIVHPGKGILAVLWLISVYAVLSGILLVVLSLKVRSLRGKVGDRIAELRG